MNDTEENDVILICGSNRYRCKRSVLSAHSDYFRAMFTSPMIESKSREVILRDVTPSALKILIDYANTNKFQATNRNVRPVLEAASMFHFDAVQTACIEFLLSILTIKNCLSIMCCADCLGIQKLLQSSRQMALWQFSDVINGREFLQMQVSGVEIYLSNDGLRLNSEMEVFDAIEKWIDHEPEIRENNLMRLIETIRFRDVTVPELNEMLRKEKIKKTSDCVRLLTSIKKMKNLEGRSRRVKTLEQIDSVAMRLLGAASRVMPLVPAVIGRGFENEEPILMYFDGENKKMVKLCELSKVTSNGNVATGFRACVVGERIYVMGGEFYLGCSNWNVTMWSLDTFRNTWEHETTLPTQRRHQCVCVLDEFIYLIGGVGRYRIVLTSVERYDTINKSWHTLSPTPIPTFSSACTAHEGKIYLLLSQVHCYDPKMNSWTTLRRSDLPNEYGFHSALPHAHGIYLVGKHSKNLTLYFTNCDDRGEDKKAYTILGAFQYSTSNACIVGDKIYSFGDNDGLVVVEVYDIISKIFSILYRDKKDVKAPLLSNGCFPLPLYS